ncbi:MAG: lipid-A-disaccharide synthase [Parachlamydiales bacterium]|jgi:lipid-A-disaccharide synthase
MSKLFIVTGEQSGDAHAADLVKALKDKCGPLDCYGVVGSALRAQGVKEIARAEDLSVMGFTDVIKVFPRLVRIYKTVRDSILTLNPDVVLMVDATSFNLRLAKSLRKNGFKGKLVQYVSPSVWAWGSHRIQLMADTLDLLLTIYPFEKKCFAETGLKVEYVGNPVLVKANKHSYDTEWREKAGIPKHEDLIALFPGSRQGEILRNLPVMIKAIEQLPQNTYSIAVSSANAICGPLIKQCLEKSALKSYIVPNAVAHQELMAESAAAIAKSGTVTLELALQQCPTIVAYQLTTLNRLVAKYVLKVNLPYYCIVNILSDEQVFPEYIVNKPTPENLSHSLWQLINDSSERKKCLEGCLKVRQLLSTDELMNEKCAKLLAEEFK